VICKFSMGKRSGGSGCDVTCFPVLAQIKRAIHIALRVEQLQLDVITSLINISQFGL